MTGSRTSDLKRIEAALDLAVAALAPFTPGQIAASLKSGGDPVTAADRAVNEALEGFLPVAGEGWLSEETADDARRLAARRVWVVDPVDGTREFVEGLPEWCISVGLVEDGRPVAGGIRNPATGDTMLGAAGLGVTHNGRPAAVSATESLAGVTVLASRSEVRRGEWERFASAPFTVQPMGSVAYKMARVAAGLEPATWTLVPKHEWDVAAGAALVLAAGGVVRCLDGTEPDFNRPAPKLDGLIACGAAIAPEVLGLLDVPARD